MSVQNIITRLIVDVYNDCPSLLFCLSVLQQAGRNPSQKALDKYWPPGTKKLNFDDFCEILKKEKPAEPDQLMRIFKKFDVNCDGYISHEELSRILTSVSVKFVPFSLYNSVCLLL